MTTKPLVTLQQLSFGSRAFKEGLDANSNGSTDRLLRRLCCFSVTQDPSFLLLLIVLIAFRGNLLFHDSGHVLWMGFSPPWG